jgi:DNA-binding HxlR family transcriptional regulator
MDQGQLSLLVKFFKTMADESRIRMIGLLGDGERNVGELAALLELTEPTVSHHLSRLRELGLVNLRMDGNRRYYRLNHQTLERLSRITFDLGNADFKSKKVESDNDWIDELDLSEEDRKVLKDYVEYGRLKQIPAKQKKLMAVLRFLALEFEPDVQYAEQEVNIIILRYHEDYASLRRDLISFGFMRREGGGGKYWLTPERVAE